MKTSCAAVLIAMVFVLLNGLPVFAEDNGWLIQKWEDDHGDDGSIDAVTNYTYVYDGNDRLMQRISITTGGYDDETVRTEYTYDANGNKLTERSEYDDENDGIVDTVITFTYTYDSNRNLITKTDQRQMYSTTYTYTYDANGRKTVEREEYDRNNDGSVDSVTVTGITYDANGRKIAEQILYDDDNNGIYDSTEDKNYTYDAGGNLVFERTQVDNNNDLTYDGRIDSVYTYTTDASGKRVYERAEFIDANGTVTGVHIYDSIYDNLGNRIVERIMFDNDNDGVYDLNHYVLKSYDHNGNYRSIVFDNGNDGTVEEVSYVTWQQAEPNDVDNDDDGYKENQGDCDDANAAINPGAEDICGDGIDQNCDGIDSDCAPDPSIIDDDGDGYTENQGDCDDTNAAINPAAFEICGDGIDQDCDGMDNDCWPDPREIDDDGDGFEENRGDCDDTNASVYPGAVEICGDGIDQDCNGSDLNCSSGSAYIDDDADGYNENQGDCDDGNNSIYPGALEICGDGIDQDCDGRDLACTGTLTEPRGLAANAVSYRKILLRWTDKSTGEDGFKIERKKRGCNSSYAWAQIATVGANVNTYADADFEPDTQYSYRVRAYKGSDNSAYSNCGTTVSGISGTPSAPVNLVANCVSSSMVDLTWDEWSSNVTEFKIYRNADGADSWALLATTGSDTFKYRDNTAAGNQSATGYCYYVRACNDKGCSPPTYTVCMPFNPTNLTAAAGSGGKIVLSWVDNSNNERGFEIYRKNGDCSSSASWEKLKLAGINRTTVSDKKGLVSGTTYSYKIRAYCRSWGLPYVYGYSSWSDCVEITAP